MKDIFKLTAIIAAFLAVIVLVPHKAIMAQGPTSGAFAQPGRIGHFSGATSGSCNAGRDLAIDSVDQTFSFCGSASTWLLEPLSNLINCGTTATCAATQTFGGHVVMGNVALSSASPSTAAITGLSPAFTSASTYSCTVNDQTTRTNQVAILAAGYVSGSAFTITGPNTVTDTVNYICIGN